MTKNSTSLHMIVKDEVEAVKDIVLQAGSYFDDIYLTVSDKIASKELKKHLNYPKVHIDYRPWNDRFDDARNHNWDLGKHHYASMWLDAGRPVRV